MSLPRYREYKDSGVEWLGQVPRHWEVRRLKMKLKLLTDKAEQRAYPVALENIESWSGCYVGTTGEFEGDGVAFSAGDILFGKLRPYLAKVYLAERAGEAVGDFHVLRPEQGVNARFVQYQILSRNFIDVIDGSTFGSKMPRASWEALGDMPLLTPPTDEQITIAAFLDRETAKIDALIAEQEKLIALLAEKRQAAISHAVTKGLNPEAPMRDTGVAWLGGVPVHWEIPPLYLRYTAELGKMLDSSRITGTHSVPYLRNVDVQWDSINITNLPCMDIEQDDYNRYTVRDGDLLVCEGGEVGRAAVVHVGNAIVGYQKALHRLRAASEGEHPRYMFYTFAWASKAGAFAGEGQSTIAHLTGEQLRKYRFPKPPHEEQVAISDFLDAEVERLKGLAQAASRAVELLGERRAALIAAAVTGQIDVRGAISTPATTPEQLAA